MALSIPTITLNDGRAMPLLGLGTYKSTEKEAEKERDMIAGCISKGMDLEQIFEEHKKACWSKEREAEQPYRAYEMNTKIIIKRMMKEAGINTASEK